MLTHLVDFAWTAHATNTSQLSNSKVHNALLSITQISHLSQDTIIFSFLLNKFFWPSGVGFPISTLRFIYITTQCSCSASGSLGKMPDSNPGPLPYQKSDALHHWEPLHLPKPPDRTRVLFTFLSSIRHSCIEKRINFKGHWKEGLSKHPLVPLRS